MGRAPQTTLEIPDREVVITNPDKVCFPLAGPGALRDIAARLIVIERYVDGAEGQPFLQKRAPEQPPEWVETVELRVDLDPGPGVAWADVQAVAPIVRAVLEEHGLLGWPKTSGSRGMHVNVRIARRWSFDEVRSLSAEERRLLAADESLVSEGDALALLHPPLPFGIFNLKLMKCGGIRPALRIAAMAETAGVDLMWGCMDESAVGIAAALHAAFAAPNTRYLDLDGSFDLAHDFAAGGFLLRDGELSTLDLPGLGVEPARP